MTKRLIDVLVSLLVLILGAPFILLSALKGGGFQGLGAKDAPSSLESIIAPYLHLEKVFKGRRSMRMMQPLPRYVICFYAGIINTLMCSDALFADFLLAKSFYQSRKLLFALF